MGEPHRKRFNFINGERINLRVPELSQLLLTDTVVWCSNRRQEENNHKILHFVTKSRSPNRGAEQAFSR